MQSQKRVSLNTSMKDAKIFEDDSDDEKETLSFEKLLKRASLRIKKEPEDVPEVSDQKNAVTFELARVKLKTEMKKEEDSGISISSAVAEMQLITPIKKEEPETNCKSANLKSAKRSLLKQRNSPYTKEVISYATRSATSMKDREKEDTLYEQLRKSTRNLNENGRKPMVSDKEVLKRRQKQIDFGKNTIGYDNYIKLVPKSERKPEDPATPNKHRVYSRRGFDGLIRQWRLKLHKYDPEEA